MSNRKSSDILEDIIRCISHIEVYTQGLSYEEFAVNYMVTEACLYNIQVIGEAANLLPDEIKQSDQTIPWNLIKGMRNRLIHNYFGTDLPVVWNVITNELPDLKNKIQGLITGSADH